jgi:hypothetical protein
MVWMIVLHSLCAVLVAVRYHILIHTFAARGAACTFTRTQPETPPSMSLVALPIIFTAFYSSPIPVYVRVPDYSHYVLPLCK